MPGFHGLNLEKRTNEKGENARVERKFILTPRDTTVGTVSVREYMIHRG
jgi:hypothetical protein